MYVFDTCVFGEKLQLYSRGSRASIKKQYLTIEPWSTQNLHCSHPTHSFHNQSCRAKQSESTGKTMGAGARPTGPFRAAEGPVWTPNAQITSHIMRGLAQQALPPFLSFHTHTHRSMWHYCWSPVLFSLVTTLIIASTAALHVSVWPSEKDRKLAWDRVVLGAKVIHTPRWLDWKPSLFC